MSDTNRQQELTAELQKVLTRNHRTITSRAEAILAVFGRAGQDELLRAALYEHWLATDGTERHSGPELTSGGITDEEWDSELSKPYAAHFLIDLQGLLRENPPLREVLVPRLMELVRKSPNPMVALALVLAERVTPYVQAPAPDATLVFPPEDSDMRPELVRARTEIHRIVDLESKGYYPTLAHALHATRWVIEDSKFTPYDRVVLLAEAAQHWGFKLAMMDATDRVRKNMRREPR